jgi:hypothetical protein
VEAEKENAPTGDLDLEGAALPVDDLIPGEENIGYDSKLQEDVRK